MLHLALLLSLAAPSVTADDVSWPQFRGPRGDGLATAATHPMRWGPEENVAWSVALPGAGWSSPIVVGDRVFLTTAVRADGSRVKGWQDGVADPATYGRGASPEKEVSFRVMALALAGGEILWDTEILSAVPRYGVHPSNTYATETPATDGEHLFVNFASAGVLAALTLEGEEVWRATYEVRKTNNDFGTGSSVTLHAGLVYVQFDNDEESFLQAHDVETGETAWRADRPTGSSWSTPSLWEHGDIVDLVACGPDHVVAYDPASGDVRWKVTGIGGSFSASPAFDDEHFYTGNSGPMARGPLFAVAGAAEGEHDLRGEDAPVAWVTDRAGPGMASPIVADGMLFVLGSMGILECVDAASGERLWRERLPESSTVVASPWVVDGHLFILDEGGKTFVVAVSPEFEVVEVNELEGLFWSTPSVAGEGLLVRSAERLTCIRE